MPLPKNAFAYDICRKPFNNPTILIKHVEFRHFTGEQTPKSKSGSGPKEKDSIRNANRDPLEIHIVISVTPHEGQTEGINHLNENSSRDQVPGNISTANFVFENQLLQFEKRNNCKHFFGHTKGCGCHPKHSHIKQKLLHKREEGNRIFEISDEF